MQNIDTANLMELYYKQRNYSRKTGFMSQNFNGFGGFGRVG